MPTEEQNGEATNRDDTISERSFDALAKGLAAGSVSRRKALRLMGGAVLGGLLASIPGVALAAPCPRTRIRCAGQCCAEGVTTCQGTGRNKTCGPLPVANPCAGAYCGTNPTGQTCVCRAEMGTNEAVCIESTTYYCTDICTSNSQCPPGTVCVNQNTGSVLSPEGRCSTPCGGGCPYTTQCCAEGFPSTETCDPIQVAGQCAGY